jgi:hypothetical protein
MGSSISKAATAAADFAASDLALEMQLTWPQRMRRDRERIRDENSLQTT